MCASPFIDESESRAGVAPARLQRKPTLESNHTIGICDPDGPRWRRATGVLATLMRCGDMLLYGIKIGQLRIEIEIEIEIKIER